MRHNKKTAAAERSIKNGGYSLVEIIVVVAILAVAATILGLSVNNIFALNVKSCAKSIAGEIGKEKVAAMTRTGEVYLHLYENEQGVFIDLYENGAVVKQEIKVGKSSVKITWYTETNTTGTVLDENGIILAFNKSDGSFMTIGEARALHDLLIPGYGGEYFKSITVSSAGTSRTISLWPLTGKIELLA